MVVKIERSEHPKAKEVREDGPLVVQWIIVKQVPENDCAVCFSVEAYCTSNRHWSAFTAAVKHSAIHS